MMDFFLEASIIRSVSKDKEKVAQNIANLSKNCQILILWLDCDREGEAIAFEVIDICLKSNRNLEIWRAHFSALTRVDIENAMRTLRRPNKNLADVNFLNINSIV